jgi:hypothetical protein
MRKASSRTGPGARATSRAASRTRRAVCSKGVVVTGSAYKHQVVTVHDQVGHVLG